MASGWPLSLEDAGALACVRRSVDRREKELEREITMGVGASRRPVMLLVDAAVGNGGALGVFAMTDSMMVVVVSWLRT
ncbi:hypothetical protein HanIR_Chr05g0243871 [Helianthus annuus]|nr:hypothetical protein HanIR_Chr05g0243871 [Helianthus annuus]